jgi:hypothetical protein
MWVEWSVGGAADLAKRNPEPPMGGDAYTDLLGDVGVTLFFFFFLISPILFHCFYFHGLIKSIVKLIDIINRNKV